MSNLVPPPEEPLDPATRARIKARLAEGTADRRPSMLRPWLMPLGAAAAVLVIASGLGYAAFWSGGDAEPTPGAGPTTAASEPASVATKPIPTDTSEATPTRPPSGGPIARDGCAAAVGEQLDGAEQVVTWELPKGEAGIWVAGETSVLCEDSGGIATAHGAQQPVTFDRQFASESLRFSSSTYLMDRRQILTAYVAGGPLPEGVTGIEYLFPDGHEQRADFRTDDSGRQWWSMGYVPYDGPMADPDRNILDFDPVKVTVSLSGMAYDYTLRWGRDDCAQVNHGC